MVDIYERLTGDGEQQVTILDLEKFFIEAEVFKILCSIFQHKNNTIQVLHLTLQTLCYGRMNSLISALGHVNCHITHLNLHGVRKSRDDFLLLARSFSKDLNKIQVLDLTRTEFDIEFFDLFCRSAFEGSQKKHLRQLILIRNNLTDVFMRQLLRAISQKGNCLEHLDLSYNPLEKAGYNVLARCLMHSNNRITSLNLFETPCSETSHDFFSSALSNVNNRLTKLELDEHSVGFSNFMHLCASLTSPNTKLSHLNFSYGSMELCNPVFFTQVLAHSGNKLTRLELFDVELDSIQFNQLALSFSFPSNRLQFFNINGAYKIRSEDMYKFKEILTTKNLYLLYLHCPDLEYYDELTSHFENRRAREEVLTSNSSILPSRLFIELNGTVNVDQNFPFDYNPYDIQAPVFDEVDEEVVELMDFFDYEEEEEAVKIVENENVIEILEDEEEEEEANEIVSENENEVVEIVVEKDKEEKEAEEILKRVEELKEEVVMKLGDEELNEEVTMKLGDEELNEEVTMKLGEEELNEEVTMKLGEEELNEEVTMKLGEEEVENMKESIEVNEILSNLIITEVPMDKLPNKNVVEEKLCVITPPPPVLIEASLVASPVIPVFTVPNVLNNLQILVETLENLETPDEKLVKEKNRQHYYKFDAILPEEVRRSKKHRNLTPLQDELTSGESNLESSDESTQSTLQLDNTPRRRSTRKRTPNVKFTYSTKGG